MPEYKVVEINNLKILMLHGHQIIPRNDLEALNLLRIEFGVDIVVFGGTNEIFVEEYDKALFLNPGSATGLPSTNNE